MRPLLLMIYDDVLQTGDGGVRVFGYGFHHAVQYLTCLPEEELLIPDGLGQYQLIAAGHGAGEPVIGHEAVKGVPLITAVHRLSGDGDGVYLDDGVMRDAAELLDGAHLCFVELIQVTVLGLEITDQLCILSAKLLQLLYGELQGADLGGVERVTDQVSVCLLQQRLGVLSVLVTLTCELADLAILNDHGGEDQQEGDND